MFEREVIADTPAQVEAQTRDLIDWLVDQDYRQWQAVMDYLNQRIARHDDHLVGEVGGVRTGRQQLIESVGRAAREVVATYDPRPRRELGDSVQQSRRPRWSRSARSGWKRSWSRSWPRPWPT